LKLEIQTTIRGALQENELYYGDYELVNGIYYPFAVEQAQKGSASRAQISVEKIEQNVPLEDAHFSMPVAKPETKAPPAGKGFSAAGKSMDGTDTKEPLFLLYR